MSNYTQSTNFATKDALPSGDPLKIVKGTEINTEFNNISVAIATKADLVSPTFTGTPAAPTAWFGNSSGRPVVNSTLYESDPRYRSAWDAVAANHQNNFGQGYTRDSDRNALQQHMQQLLRLHCQQLQEFGAPL